MSVAISRRICGQMKVFEGEIEPGERTAEGNDFTKLVRLRRDAVHEGASKFFEASPRTRCPRMREGDASSLSVRGMCSVQKQTCSFTRDETNV